MPDLSGGYLCDMIGSLLNQRDSRLKAREVNIYLYSKHAAVKTDLANTTSYTDYPREQTKCTGSFCIVFAAMSRFLVVDTLLNGGTTHSYPQSFS